MTNHAGDREPKDTTRADTYVRTLIVHQRRNVPTEWWHRAVFMEVPGIVDEVAAAMLKPCMFAMARVGASAVIFRPALVDLTGSTVIADLVKEAHRVGLKVVVRLSGATFSGRPSSTEDALFFGLESDPATLVVRAREALKLGVDGIDLGGIREWSTRADAAQRAQHFRALTRILQVELADFSPNHTLSASAELLDIDAFVRHQEEEWFHNLRAGSLYRATFDTHAIRTAIDETLQACDRVGAVPSWKAIAPQILADPHERKGTTRTWEQDADTARRTAMRLLLCALPGSIYLPFEFIGGHVEYVHSAVRPQPAQSEKEKARAKHTGLALRLRQELCMGDDTFAWVEGLPWQNPDTLVSTTGNILNVLNTGSDPIEVPAEHRLLIRSDSTGEEDVPAAGPVFSGEGLRRVPPAPAGTRLRGGSCAWFIPERVAAQDVAAYR
ncbi:hypothetical protein [Gleimia hominis]|uniref:hypothetical protein n=1 Tax=Gleimia hominis TaxID=595468 RepID=UPI0011AF7079|nr:hypothetical protein [Gleimia hominis]WIK64911.1 hypothetical protein CJ187_002320 [Gleimia hominis]